MCHHLTTAQLQLNDFITTASIMILTFAYKHHFCAAATEALASFFTASNMSQIVEKIASGDFVASTRMCNFCFM